MIALGLAVFVAALAGSVHCAAMCGPLASLAMGPRGRLPAGLGYAGGRLVAYVTLGALAGGLGAGVDLVGELLSFARLAMIAAGVTLLAWGSWSLARALGWVTRTPGAGATRPMLHAIRRRRPAWRGALVGVFTAALPCGWLYAFVAVAAGTGAPLTGAAVMAIFWLGSTPATLGGGAVLRILGRLVGRRAPVMVAVLQIAIGALVLIVRLPVLSYAPSALHQAMDVPGAPACH